MSSGIVAFLFGISVAAWSYSKLTRRTGAGNAQTAVIGAGIIFVLCFIFFYTLLKWVLHI